MGSGTFGKRLAFGGSIFSSALGLQGGAIFEANAFGLLIVMGGYITNV